MEQIEKNTILIVDDNPNNLKVLTTFLEELGFSILVAMSGEKALEITEKYLPDLILLDVMMPRMDGFEVCEHLKEREKTKDIPVIFLTAKTETAQVIKGFDTGAVDYVTKPFNSLELHSRVKIQLALKQSKDLIRKHNEEHKQLLHVLCHDLINPIAFVLSTLHISKKDSKIWEQMKDNIENVMNNSIECIELIREMQALTEGKYQIKLQSYNLLSLIKESITILNHRLSDKKIDIETNIQKDISVLIEKTSFVNSVFNNILTNAIKFSYPNSKIIITAEQHKHITNLIIKDVGIGIPEKLLSNIYEMNKPTTRRGTNNEMGTGFGMPLVRKFMTAYGGEIEIVSNEKTDKSKNHGTEVKLILKNGTS